MATDETTDSELTVANTILAQLGGSRALKLMIGATNLYGDENSLSIAWKAQSKNKAKGVNIKLEASDTYTVKFRKVVNRTVVTVSEHTDVYAEDLIPLFERETGLIIRLPGIRRA